eukprot:c15731_g2_i1 orf=463-681(-)
MQQSSLGGAKSDAETDSVDRDCAAMLHYEAQHRYLGVHRFSSNGSFDTYHYQSETFPGKNEDPLTMVQPFPD